MKEYPKMLYREGEGKVAHNEAEETDMRKVGFRVVGEEPALIMPADVTSMNKGGRPRKVS